MGRRARSIEHILMQCEKQTTQPSVRNIATIINRRRALFEHNDKSRRRALLAMFLRILEIKNKHARVRMIIRTYVLYPKRTFAYAMTHVNSRTINAFVHALNM